MLDSSSSMGVEKMKMSRKFTEQLIRNFRIGLNKTRLALLTFDSKPHLKWDLRDSINNDEMKRSLTELKYDNGVGTNTGLINCKLLEHQYNLNYYLWEGGNKNCRLS